MTLMRWLRAVAAVAALVLAAACEQATDPTGSIDPDLTISDGAHEGNPRVFFLPPMVPDPSGEFTAGSFVGTIDVVIKVCIWNTGLDACISPVLETYTRSSGPGSETVRVPDGEEFYLVNWHTGDILDSYTLGVGEVFRIVVEVEETIIAFADVEVVASGQELVELRNAKSGDVIPLLDGRTLAIRVRIEEGWEDYGAVLAALEAGGFHTCVLTSEGTAYCWGHGLYGQLGDGSFYTTYPWAVTGPVAVDQSLTGTFAALTSGGYDTCGLTSDGTAYCWGRGHVGQLGNGSTAHSAVPVAVDQSVSGAFASLTVGTWHICGLNTDGLAYCWGANGNGQLGNGSRAYSAVPVAVDQSVSGRFASLTTEGAHTCGLKPDGTAYCWGRGQWGELGDGNFYTNWPYLGALTPVAVDQSVSGAFASLSPGGIHTCGLTTNGTAYCWGAGLYGQLGNGSNANSAVPVAVDQSLSGAFASLTLGSYHTCGLATVGTAYCWGYGLYGQLGDGNYYSTYPWAAVTPVAVDQSLSGAFVSVTAGYVHTCGLTMDTRAYCWGYGVYGQLGNGTLISNAPGDPVLDPPEGW